MTSTAKNTIKESFEDSKLKQEDCNVASEMPKYTAKMQAKRNWNQKMQNAKKDPNRKLIQWKWDKQKECDDNWKKIFLLSVGILF